MKKTIVRAFSLDIPVSKALDKRANQHDSSASKIVNRILKEALNGKKRR
jgi:plasmid stability protein